MSNNRRSIQEIEAEIEERLLGSRGPRVPVNTLQELREAPQIVLGAAMILGPELVPVQEKQGQSSLVKSDTLPTEGLQGLKDIPGLEIGEQVKGDHLFTMVKLPEGWTKRGTDHPLWSDLLDEKGRKRATIMYKAASYDRDASISAASRLSVRMDYDLKKRTGEHSAVVRLDGKTEVFRTPPRTAKPGEKEWKLSEDAEMEACQWLNVHYPDWKKVSAYWDSDELPPPCEPPQTE